MLYFLRWLISTFQSQFSTSGTREIKWWTICEPETLWMICQFPWGDKILCCQPTLKTLINNNLSFFFLSECFINFQLENGPYNTQVMNLHMWSHYHACGPIISGPNHEEVQRPLIQCPCGATPNRCETWYRACILSSSSVLSPNQL